MASFDLGHLSAPLYFLLCKRLKSLPAPPPPGDAQNNQWRNLKPGQRPTGGGGGLGSCFQWAGPGLGRDIGEKVHSVAQGTAGS